MLLQHIGHRETKNNFQYRERKSKLVRDVKMAKMRFLGLLGRVFLSTILMVLAGVVPN